jgi:uncharacterized protein DUF6603
VATPLTQHLDAVRKALEDGQAGSPLMAALRADPPDTAALLRALGGDLDGPAADVWRALTELLGATLRDRWALEVPGVGSIAPSPAPLPDVPPLPPGAVLTLRVADGGHWAAPGGVGAIDIGAFELDLDLGKQRIALRAAGLKLEAGDPSGILTMLGFGSLAVGGDVGAVVDAGGFRFTGGGQHEIELAASTPLPLSDPRFGLGFDPQTGRLGLTASFAGKALGMTALVDKVGLTFAFAGGAPTLAAKGPDGVGLSLDASSGVSGGGFLGRRDDAFGGVLNLDVGPVEVTAFGLLHPDPFSLIIVLSAEFSPGIQLSFGFMLNGVGGVIGIGHRVDAAGLADVVQKGTVDQLLFPDDPAASAPAILTTLERVFPRDPESALFGPLFRLGWGPAVPLMTADVGVILELPEVRFVLLGRLRIALPHPELAIVDLRASLSGLIDPARGLVEVNVSLSGSRVSGFAVSGGLVARVQTSGGGELIFSAGGFHPRWTPPPGLPVPQRLEIKLADLPLLQITFSGYVALTSGTVQAGARLDLVAGTDDLGLSGTLGFDVLIQWSPSFAFSAQVHASLGFKFLGATVCAVSLDVLLEGPAPCWHVSGRASIRVLLAKPSFAVDESWGRQDERPLKAPDVAAEVLRALERPEAWAPVMPAGGAGILRLRAARPGEEEPPRIHPLGQLSVRQEVAPLNAPLTRFGAAPLPAPTTLAVDAVAGGGLGKEPKRDLFAAGQFFTRSEDEQLTMPAFEEFDSGVTVASAGVKRSPNPRSVAMSYEDKTIGGADGSFHLFAERWVELALASGAVGRSALHADRVRYAAVNPPMLPKVDPAMDRPVAVDTRTGQYFEVAGVDAARTFAEAAQALAAESRRRDTVALGATWELEP